jgi:predicted nucleotidyltransferase
MSLTPLKALKEIVKVLSAEACSFCLIGGHAASLYRSQERFTKDVDFALVSDTPRKSRQVAERAIAALGLRSVVGFIPHGQHEKPRNSVCMITSEPMKGQLTGLVDILLPEIVWVTHAVQRAQANRIDLGFDMVPVITPEDLIVAKCFAFRNSPDRFQDLDDLKELLTHVKNLDVDYLRRQLEAYSLEVPEPVRKFAPRSIRR